MKNPVDFPPLPTYYPVFLDLVGKPCLVVGGGEIAIRKAEGLLIAGAIVTMVATQCQAAPTSAYLRIKGYDITDLEGQLLVFAATDDVVLNAQIAKEAVAKGLWVNAVDDPARCSFILPAVVRRGALTLAISTAGASPALARRLKEQLEEVYGPVYEELVDALWQLRKTWERAAQASGLAFPDRKQVWEDVLDLLMSEWLKQGRRLEAMEGARSILIAAFGPPVG